jgi:protein-tyrosine phosphatase
MVVPSVFRRLLHYVQRAPDRLKHRSRRRAATETLRTFGVPRTILVVCHANLCRSPYAAATLRRRLEAAGTPIHVESAGFFGSNRGAPPEALAAAAERQADLTGHRSRTIDRPMLEGADLIVTMEPGQARAVTARYAHVTRSVLVLGDLDPLPITTREIVDPYGRAREWYDGCYDRIDRCVGELVRLLTDRD